MRRVGVGWAVVGLVAGCAVAPASAANRIYWANDLGRKISVANLDGSGNGSDLSTAGATNSRPRGLAVDLAHNRIYWANFSGSQISVANLDGSGNGSDLATTGATVNAPEGVAVDPAHNRVYWANSAGNRISVANLDGSGNGSDLNTTGATVNQPEGVAVDPAHNRIYWANTAGNTISMANLDGSGNGSDLNTTGATVTGPEGVAVDPAHNRIYWASASGIPGKISVANLDGTGSGADLATTGATSFTPNFPVLVEAPAATGAPSVSGAGTTGSSLSCSQGSWAGDLLGAFLYQTPAAFSYAWQLNGSDVAGASGPSLTATSPGSYTCRVTATNLAGATSQTSAPVTVTSPPGSTPPAPAPAGSPPFPALLAPPPTPPAPNSFTIGTVTANRATGAVTVTATLPGPGGVDVLGTHDQGAGAAAVRRWPGPGRITYGRAYRSVARAGTDTLTFEPGPAGQRMLRRTRRLGEPLSLTVWVTYTPIHGHTNSKSHYVRVLTRRAGR